MGRSGSSSKRKHSKKKSHKVSSEVGRKKKSRRNKSKKLHHHDDSFSSCSDDESSSSSVFSSSSSESEYKRKKTRSRSRARKEVKSSKKRTRKRSLSEDSVEDSPPVKKRKGSRKKKKIKKKKKSKRYDYISSSNSDSASCSTCSSDDVASHVRSREKKKDHRYSTKGKIGNMQNKGRSRSRSRSRSYSSPSNDFDDENIENVTVETNSRRLKSVITVANQETEKQDDMKKDELKEEIVYDYDDYPSCKSNDSNELNEKKPISENVISEVNSVSEVDDLELKLRQKALENLSKFRKTKTVVNVNVDDKNKSDQVISASVDHGQQAVIPRSRFTWRRDPSVTTGKEEKAAAYGGLQSSGSQPVVVKNKIVNEEASEMKANTNVDQKSTGDIEGGSSNEQQNERNDNSQFEKKTMTVMRGGEMVQVSYKVYIPNRTPALARRQLKR